jgi:hypothetical protein
VKTVSELTHYKVASLDNIMQVIRKELAAAEDIKEPAWAAVKQFASMCVKPHKHHADEPSAPITNQMAVIPVPVQMETVAAQHSKLNYSHRPAILRY